MHVRTTVMTAFTLLAALAATSASAEEPSVTPAAIVAAAPAQSIFGTPLARAAARSIFESSLGEAAQGTAAVTTTPANEHQFGAGLRLGSTGSGIGVGARYFFYGGPLGIQGEIARSGLDLGPREWTSVQFSPSVMYRFVERRFEAPIVLTPYGGAGLSFVHNNFRAEDEAFFQDVLQVDDTNVGVLLFGGVELFFDRVPNLGVSGELTFNSNDDIENTVFGSTSLGGVRFTAAGHWYFW